MTDCRDFHLFTALPPEIRAQIWRYAVVPRIVPVSFWVGCRFARCFGALHSAKWDKAVADYRAYVLTASPIRTQLPLDLYAKTDLPPPALLSVCRETRALGFYEKMILTPGSSASFVRINYEADMIDFDGEEDGYSFLQGCGSRIRRLRLKVDVTVEGWRRGGSWQLRKTFTQLEECFVVMEGGARIWFWRVTQYYSLIPCALDRIHFIDERINERITCAELIQMTQPELMEWVARVKALGEDIFDSDSE